MLPPRKIIKGLGKTLGADGAPTATVGLKELVATSAVVTTHLDRALEITSARDGVPIATVASREPAGTLAVGGAPMVMGDFKEPAEILEADGVLTATAGFKEPVGTLAVGGVRTSTSFQKLAR